VLYEYNFISVTLLVDAKHLTSIFPSVVLISK